MSRPYSPLGAVLAPLVLLVASSYYDVMPRDILLAPRQLHLLTS